MASNKIPNTIYIDVEGPEVSGLLIGLTFPTSFKNQFHYSVFLDESGHAVVTHELLLNSFDESLRLALMDHGDPREVIEGNVIAEVKNVSDLRSALSAYYVYEKVAQFEDGYERKLTELIKRCPKPDKYKIKLTIQN